MREYVVGATKADADYVASQLDIHPVYAITRDRVAAGFLRGMARTGRIFVTEAAQLPDHRRDIESWRLAMRELNMVGIQGPTVIRLAADPA